METLAQNSYIVKEGKISMCLNYNEYNKYAEDLKQKIRTRFAFHKESKCWVGKTQRELYFQKSICEVLKLSYAGKEKEIVLEELTPQETPAPAYVEPPDTPAAGMDRLKLMGTKELVAMFESEAMPVEEQKRRDLAYEEKKKEQEAEQQREAERLAAQSIEQPADFNPIAFMQGEDQYVAESSYEPQETVYTRPVSLKKGAKTPSNSMAEIESQGLFSWVSGNNNDEDVPF